MGAPGGKRGAVFRPLRRSQQAPALRYRAFDGPTWRPIETPACGGRGAPQKRHFTASGSLISPHTGHAPSMQRLRGLPHFPHMVHG